MNSVGQSLLAGMMTSSLRRREYDQADADHPAWVLANPAASRKAAGRNGRRHDRGLFGQLGPPWPHGPEGSSQSNHRLLRHPRGCRPRGDHGPGDAASTRRSLSCIGAQRPGQQRLDGLAPLQGGPQGDGKPGDHLLPSRSHRRRAPARLPPRPVPDHPPGDPGDRRPGDPDLFPLRRAPWPVRLQSPIPVVDQTGALAAGPGRAARGGLQLPA